jgi:poly [ADP-ribose] polymerase
MDYSKLKVAELKELLKERGLSATGLSKKQLIIDALEEDDAQTGQPDEDLEEEDDAEVGVDVKPTKSTRSSTKRKASSPTPAKQAEKKPKSEPVDSPTDTTGEPAPQLADAQFAPAGANLDIPIDDGVSPTWHVYVDPDTGIIYDASLNQTNASNNNNKFYRVQVCILRSIRRHASQCSHTTSS